MTQVVGHRGYPVVVIQFRHHPDGLQGVIDKMGIDLALQHTHLRLLLAETAVRHLSDQLVNPLQHLVKVFAQKPHLISIFHLKAHVHIPSLHLLHQPGHLAERPRQKVGDDNGNGKSKAGYGQGYQNGHIPCQSCLGGHLLDRNESNHFPACFGRGGVGADIFRIVQLQGKASLIPFDPGKVWKRLCTAHHE
ncbi:hypothetical protein D3C75_897010 [compost metagenome]